MNKTDNSGNVFDGFGWLPEKHIINEERERFVNIEMFLSEEGL